MNIENIKEKLVGMFAKLADLLREYITKFVKDFFNFIKEKLPRIQEAYFKKQEQLRKVRDSWYVQKDTRRRHQVIDRKPKNLTRKIF